jgi:hypothetical protein
MYQPKLTILDDGGLDLIQDASLRILQTLGVQVPHPEVRRLFRAAGADTFGHLGICGVDQGASLDMLVMQHELVGYIGHSNLLASS